MAAVCLFDFVICHVVNVCEQVNGRFIGVVLAVSVPVAWYAVDVFAACGAKIIFLVFHFAFPFSRLLPGGSACFDLIITPLRSFGKVCKYQDR